MEIKRETRLYSLVATDLTSHCNHRCRFCYNIWGEECNMSMETFQKVIQILPYVQEGSFLLSCLYEPTRNPRFFEMARQIPRQFKNRVFFNTNLDSEYDEQDFTRLAQSNIHHVDVSLPTFDPESYKFITGSDGAAFFKNLPELRRTFDGHTNRPRLQLNTVILKSNYDEIVSIVTRAHEELRPYAHLLRTPNIFADDENVLLRGKKDNTIVESELLSRAELDTLSDELAALGYKNLVIDFSFDRETYADKQRANDYTNTNSPYDIYIGPDGKGLFMKDENPFDLADIDYPFVFFSKALIARQTHQAALHEVLDTPPVKDRSDDPDFHSFVDSMTIWDERFIWLHGWAFHRQVESGEIYIMLSAEDRQVVYRAHMEERLDVAEIFDDAKRRNTGFECLIDPTVLPHKPKQNYAVYVGVLHEGTLFTKHITDLTF